MDFDHRHKEGKIPILKALGLSFECERILRSGLSIPALFVLKMKLPVTLVLAAASGAHALSGQATTTVRAQFPLHPL